MIRNITVIIFKHTHTHTHTKMKTHFIVPHKAMHVQNDAYQAHFTLPMLHTRYFTNTFFDLYLTFDTMTK